MERGRGREGREVREEGKERTGRDEKEKNGKERIRKRGGGKSRSEYYE